MTVSWQKENRRRVGVWQLEVAHDHIEHSERRPLLGTVLRGGTARRSSRVREPAVNDPQPTSM